MEDLFQQFHLAVSGPPLRVFEKTFHLRLPAIVNLSQSHARKSLIEAGCLEISNEQPVFPQEQRVVAPTGLTQSIEHLRPHGLVPCLVLVDPVFLYSKLEANTLVMSHVEPVRVQSYVRAWMFFNPRPLIYTPDFTLLFDVEGEQALQCLYILLVALAACRRENAWQTNCPNCC